MTPERARAVIRAQSEFPYWGNFDKFMTTEEIAHCKKLFEADPDGSITFARIVYRIANSDRVTPC